MSQNQGRPLHEVLLELRVLHQRLHNIKDAFLNAELAIKLTRSATLPGFRYVLHRNIEPMQHSTQFIGTPLHFQLKPEIQTLVDRYISTANPR
ncbi:hypothetical protein Ddc_22964 [Ditylenchus destructor]|nr:hypothetical protein Ddc_22964 [Ditylenchus destructor]